MIQFFEFLKTSLFLCFLFFALKLLIFAYKSFIRPRLNLAERYGKGSYVLITGTTHGIGRQHCFEWAKLGFNLIMVARTEELLVNLDKELKLKFPDLKTKLIIFDFAKNYELKDYINNFEKLTDQFDISILINNVGAGDDRTFIDSQEDKIYELIHVNCTAQAILTKIFVNYLNSRNKKSAVISLSSVTSNIPRATKPVYSATKAFNDYLSRSLYYEYKDKNIDFLCVKPGKVYSQMQRQPVNYYDVISTEMHVNGTLNDLGYEVVTDGHFLHKIDNYVKGLYPSFIFNMIRLIKYKFK